MPEGKSNLASPLAAELLEKCTNLAIRSPDHHKLLHSGTEILAVSNIFDEISVENPEGLKEVSFFPKLVAAVKAEIEELPGLVEALIPLGRALVDIKPVSQQDRPPLPSTIGRSARQNTMPS